MKSWGESPATKTVAGLTVHYRKRHDGEVSGDERILEEVLERREYQKPRIGFDVEPGELWLDLGANIGAFALYCKSRKAKAVCFEPDAGNFKLLRKNVPSFECHQKAVTAQKTSEVTFFISEARPSHARGTTVHVKGYTAVTVPNMYAGDVASIAAFDGVKMDVEGSEAALLDKWLIPPCKKLVLEYHTSRDDSVANLKRRLKILKSKFHNVSYRPEYDRAIASGAETFKSHCDRLIFAWEPK